MCFPVEGTPLLFTGDTLFPGGPGNTSFDGADFPTIIESIEGRLFSRFGPDTQVLPGHGAGTTIGTESPHLAGVGRPGLVGEHVGPAERGGSVGTAELRAGGVRPPSRGAGARGPARSREAAR